jgi:hypothetical protein
MPIIGNLSEFPLPEVLLLIGRRTGRLRLLDIPEYGVLDIDISNGGVQAMRIGTNTLLDGLKMLDTLGTIVLTQQGMFEFRLVPISLMAAEQSLTTHDLAMKLVCHVDKQLAEQQLNTAAEQRYRLVLPQPDIWLEPELLQFFNFAGPLIKEGLAVYDLALLLQMETSRVAQNLNHLRLLELIEPIPNETGVVKMEEVIPREELTRTSKTLLMNPHTTERIRKLSSRLPAL